MIKILASVLAADPLCMGQEIGRIMQAGADGLHVDIMDAHFVPNLSFSPALSAAIRRVFPEVYQDVHLMMEDPGRYLDTFVRAGADAVTVHAECGGDISGVLRRIRALSCHPGISVKPGTPAEKIMDYLPLCDQVLIMTVEPGFGGQQFMPDMMGKIRAIRAAGYAGSIQVDGGVNVHTAEDCVRAGADTLIMGTALLRAEDPAGVMAACRRLEDADETRR